MFGTVPTPSGKASKINYKYFAKDPLFAAGWSNKGCDRLFRMVVGTIHEGERITQNKLCIVELDDNAGELVEKASVHQGYPSSGLKFVTNQDMSQPELIASATDHLRIYRYIPASATIHLECELTSTKSNNYASPLTAVDWNELDSSLVGTASIDTTCSVWNIEVSRIVGQTRGAIKTQLIAHEQPVHDIGFSRMGNGRDQFATAGSDGSVRLFDLRALQHSTILYEDPEKRALNRIAWNKRDPTYLATVAHESSELVVLDVRVPCRPLTKFSNHRGCVNGMAWAPHSGVHICTGGSDKQALIWQMQLHSVATREPILAYGADGEINQIHWSNNTQWICICFDNVLEILRV